MEPATAMPGGGGGGGSRSENQLGKAPNSVSEGEENGVHFN